METEHRLIQKIEKSRAVLMVEMATKDEMGVLKWSRTPAHIALERACLDIFAMLEQKVAEIADLRTGKDQTIQA